jgi:hypothetical protein
MGEPKGLLYVLSGETTKIEEAPIHQQPCLNPGCSYPEPHKHGYDCDPTCTTCGGHVD